MARVALDPAAHTLHRHRHRARGDPGPVAPHLEQEGLAGHGLTGPRCQEGQQAMLHRAQLEGVAAAHDARHRQVDQPVHQRDAARGQADAIDPGRQPDLQLGSGRAGQHQVVGARLQRLARAHLRSEQGEQGTAEAGLANGAQRSSARCGTAPNHNRTEHRVCQGGAQVCERHLADLEAGQDAGIAVGVDPGHQGCTLYGHGAMCIASRPGCLRRLVRSMPPPAGRCDRAVTRRQPQAALLSRRAANAASTPGEAMTRVLVAALALVLPAVASAQSLTPLSTVTLDPTIHISPSAGQSLGTAGVLVPGTTYAVAITGGPGIGYNSASARSWSIAGRDLDRIGTVQQSFSLNGMESPLSPTSYWAFLASADQQLWLYWPSDANAADNVGSVDVTVFEVTP